MIEIFGRSKNIPVPSRAGLVSALRSLKMGESFAIQASKKTSIHPAARRAGVRVTVRTLEDGTVRVWRIPSAKAATAGSASLSVPDTHQSVSDDGLDIFGQPVKTEVFK